MKLIIDIDEETVHHVRAYGLFLNPRDDQNLVNAIKNGTPIPDNATVCDIEQIRQKIISLADNNFYEYNMKFAILEIIDEYMKGE